MIGFKQKHNILLKKNYKSLQGLLPVQDMNYWSISNYFNVILKNKFTQELFNWRVKLKILKCSKVS